MPPGAEVLAVNDTLPMRTANSSSTKCQRKMALINTIPAERIPGAELPRSSDPGQDSLQVLGSDAFRLPH